MNRTSIEQRLTRLAEEIDAIEAVRPTSFEEFVEPGNTVLRTALEHRIFLATQAMLDIAAHVVVTRSLGAPATYKDAAVTLARAGIIPADLGAAMADAAGMRNAIAHLYLELDQRRLYAAVCATRDLKRFAAAIWEWLEVQQ